MMKLHWSPRSPFVRKVMVAAHELGLAERLELVRTNVAMSLPPGAAILPDNPLGKIPTLVLADGSKLYDSGVICEYLDGLSGQPRLLPRAGPQRIQVLRRQALGTGFCDMLVLWRGELMREHPSAKVLEGFALKRDAALDALEAETGLDFALGGISIAIALAYLDFRFGEFDWRGGHPKLAAWYAEVAQRPSMQATAFKEG